MTLTPEEAGRIAEMQREATEAFFKRSKAEWAAMGGFPATKTLDVTSGKAAMPADRNTRRQHNTKETTGDGSVDWRTRLARGPSGYLGDERNILMALRIAPELVGLVRFNEFSLETELTRSPPWGELSTGAAWTETDDTQLLTWLQTAEIKAHNRGAVADCVSVAARERGFHPVREYLNELKWDGITRLPTWLATYLNATGSPEYLAGVGTRFLVSAVARIIRPGCQADHVLVLEGEQGVGKTSAARVLARRPEWFAGNLPDIHSKDAPLQLAGRWIVEISELKAIRNSRVEATKTFITETRDTFRPPYGRRTAQFPRQCVFIATTNECEYLRDRSGNRRYWPVRCARIDIAALERDRDQLYAEAVHLYRAGSAWHLTDVEVRFALSEQQERVHVTELEQDVLSYLDTVEGDEVTVRDVLTYGLHLDPDKSTYAETARKLGPDVAAALERCGWRKDARRGKERRTRYRRRQG
jgi:predicted P-loop ATPase